MRKRILAEAGIEPEEESVEEASSDSSEESSSAAPQTPDEWEVLGHELGDIEE